MINLIAHVIFAVLFVASVSAGPKPVQIGGTSVNPNASNLGSTIEGSEITNGTIQSTDIEDNTITGSDIATTATVTIASMSATNLGNIPAGPPTCPSNYTRIGINKCVHFNGLLPPLASSSPVGAAHGGWFTVSSGTLDTCKTAKFRVDMTHLHGAGAAAAHALDLFMRPTGSAAGQVAGAKKCTIRTDSVSQVNDGPNCNPTMILQAGTGDFDYSCDATAGPINSTTCEIYLEECEQ